MSTLAIMKARIADELARADLTSQIVYAINDAISAYQHERWYFSESRDLTFTTVAAQEFYTSTDDADIARIVKIDWVNFYVGAQPYQLLPMRPGEMEFMSTNGVTSGYSSWYAYYDEQFRLYPIPDAAYTVRIGAQVNVDGPADDAEADNPWMVKAERLIRSRAKLELALHVLKDTDLAATMSEAVTEAFEQLKSRTNALTQVGEGRVRPMCF